MSFVFSAQKVRIRFTRMLHGRVPRQMRSYFNLCWRKSPVPFDELRILGDVHRPLRAQILRHVGALMRPELAILQVRVKWTLPCAISRELNSIGSRRMRDIPGDQLKRQR